MSPASLPARIPGPLTLILLAAAATAAAPANAAGPGAPASALSVTTSAISVAASATPVAASATAADLDGNRVVDAADVQAFLKRIAEGAPPASLDLDGDGAVDLEDALLFGRWVNGLWQKPAAGFAPLQFRNPADEAAFRQYPEDVKANKTLTAGALAARYPERAAAAPGYARGAVEFEGRVDSALSALNPSWQPDSFLAQVRREGAAVAPQATFPNYFQALDYIHNRDLPLLFTTDALLHTVYLSYDNILIELETSRLIPALDRILLDARAYALAHHPEGDAARDVREMLETALLLLKPGRTDVAPSAGTEANLALVSGLAFRPAKLYGRDTVFDFSQFKPRGHYTRTPELSQYFRAMLWLSRADLALDLRARADGGTDPAYARMKRAAFILWDAVVGSGSYPAWLEMNRLLEYLVGACDGLTLKGMGTLAHTLSVRRVADYVAGFDAAAEAAFDAALAASGLGMQAILSQGKVFAPGDPLDLSPILSFMPQRFVLDSYTFSQLVHPVAEGRALPSSLDAAFVLGDNSALADMAASPAGAAPPGLLASQRALYDRISPMGWRSNLYAAWVDFLRQLNPSDNAAFAPAFRTAAWNRKMRNTQLASWAQLRHNTILYVKQSYTGGIICEFPRAYVEPYPAFFAAVADYAKLGRGVFADRPKAAEYFANLETVSARLAEVAARAARGQQPTDDQTRWLQGALTSTPPSGMCGSVRVYDGWYPKLIYGTLREPAERTRDYTIADVHTKPYMDELGPPQVLHAATGRIHLLAAAVQLDTCVSLFVGPVGSFYDVNRVSGADGKLIRMTDEEWTEEVEAGSDRVVRPAWVRPFLGPR